MSEPQRDDRSVDTGVQQLHGGSVPQGVRCYVLVAQRFTMPRGGRDVFGYKPFDGVDAESVTLPRRKQRGISLAVVLAQPDTQDHDSLSGQWRHALLTALAVHPDVGAAAEFDVGERERGEFADAQTGLHGEYEQGVVAAAVPAGSVGCIQQGIDLLASGVSQFWLTTCSSLVRAR